MILNKAEREMLRSRAIFVRESFRAWGVTNLIKEVLLCFIRLLLDMSGTNLGQVNSYKHIGRVVVKRIVFRRFCI